MKKKDAIHMKKKNVNEEGHDCCEEEEGNDESEHDEEHDESCCMAKTM